MFMGFVMKVAVVGSRGLHVEDLGRYLPADTTEIVSGGAVGVDMHWRTDFCLPSSARTIPVTDAVRPCAATVRL